jgi:hypothetical protein
MVLDCKEFLLGTWNVLAIPLFTMVFCPFEQLHGALESDYIVLHHLILT